MTVPPVLKKIGVILAKLAVLYLALIVLWMDIVLLATALPRFFALWQPFVQSAVAVLFISALISVAQRSKTPVLFVVFCIAYSALAISANIYYLIVFVAFFCVVAAINFLYRNKVTEPLLVMLLIITGAWVFISLFYFPFLGAWAHYAWKKEVSVAFVEGFRALPDQLVVTSFMAPVLVMYFLGKHSYVPTYSCLASVYRKCRERLSA